MFPAFTVDCGDGNIFSIAIKYSVSHGEDWIHRFLCYLMIALYIKRSKRQSRMSSMIIPDVFIPPRPWQWIRSFTGARFCPILCPFRHGDDHYAVPFLYVIITRHEWWIIMVDLGPKGTETWTIHIQSGLGTSSTSVAVFFPSYYDILWPMWNINNESRTVLFWTL